MTDYSAGQAWLEEPAAVKSALPMAYVLEKAGVRLTASDSRLTAICPFHNDHDPSFDVYRWGSGERFGCWVCGIGGDVFDLMQRIWPQLGFRAAVETGKRAIQAMKDEGWVAPKLEGKIPFNRKAAEEILCRANRSDQAGVQKLIERKGWPFDAAWLRNRWGVCSLGDEVIVPYKNFQSEVVAVKHRPATGTRPLISLPGSRLDLLYRPVTDFRPLTLILTEGESDAWTADWLLHEQFRVASIPAGAGATPLPGEIARFEHVIICFDGDEAGRTGALRWSEASPANTQVMTLPEGMDIASMDGELFKQWAIQFNSMCGW